VSQLELFTAAKPLPEGLVYQPDFLSVEEETALLDDLAGLEFAEIKMHGVIAKRRAAHFGMDYDP
jgi:DNA oxidative demethylase